MAKFLIGFTIGAYAGAMMREEYYFPTPEKIERAFRIYKKNEEAIEKSYKRRR